ncbi:MAG UNVERIFIED_CONTAM: hypothetical protein LVQ98_08375 [Rickettsiaceae bacterium]
MEIFNKIDNLRGSLVLVVTQGLKSETAEDETTSYAHSTPDQYLHKFQELSAQVTDPDTLALLHILSNAPIAVFPKILKADVVDGRLNPDLLTTWNGAIRYFDKLYKSSVG